MLEDLQGSILAAIAISAMMIGTVIFIIFYHDSKHDEIDRWVDFAFSGNTLRQALGYYRFMAVSMLFFYVLFTCSCLYLQHEGFMIFSNGSEPVFGGPIATALFAEDRSVFVRMQGPAEAVAAQTDARGGALIRLTPAD